MFMFCEYKIYFDISKCEAYQEVLVVLRYLWKKLFRLTACYTALPVNKFSRKLMLPGFKHFPEKFRGVLRTQSNILR